MSEIDNDIRMVLSQMRLVHEIQTSKLVDQAIALINLEASLLGKDDTNKWNIYGED